MQYACLQKWVLTPRGLTLRRLTRPASKHRVWINKKAWITLWNLNLKSKIFKPVGQGSRWVRLMKKKWTTKISLDCLFKGQYNIFKFLNHRIILLCFSFKSSCSVLWLMVLNYEHVAPSVGKKNIDMAWKN